MKKVENIKQYVSDQLKAGAPVILAAKTERIMARPGVVGEVIVTMIKNGQNQLEETRNVVESADDLVATNPIGGESWIIKAAVVAKKYEKDPDVPGQYRPKGGAQKFIAVTEDIEFFLWGGDFRLMAGGVLNITDENDIYGIAAEPFDATYARCDDRGNILKVGKSPLVGQIRNRGNQRG
ncbi:MAG: hypothetical protein FWC51_02190 [Proteobacteria bacterium]|nr:hypothetical protein [Pseudomonadota bacterium]